MLTLDLFEILHIYDLYFFHRLVHYLLLSYSFVFLLIVRSSISFISSRISASCYLILPLYFVLGLMHYIWKHWNIINTDGAINYLLTCLVTFSFGIIEFMIQLSRYRLSIKFKARFIYIKMKFLIKWELNLIKHLTFEISVVQW